MELQEYAMRLDNLKHCMYKSLDKGKTEIKNEIQSAANTIFVFYYKLIIVKKLC